MIGMELIITAIFIGKIYKLKPVSDFPLWLFFILGICLLTNNINYNFRYRCEVEALKKLVVEISKSKVEEK